MSISFEVARSIDIRGIRAFALGLIVQNIEGVLYDLDKLDNGIAEQQAEIVSAYMSEHVRAVAYMAEYRAGPYQLSDSNQPISAAFSQSVERLQAQSPDFWVAEAWRYHMGCLADQSPYIPLILSIGDMKKSDLLSLEIEWTGKTVNECLLDYLLEIADIDVHEDITTASLSDKIQDLVQASKKQRGAAVRMYRAEMKAYLARQDTPPCALFKSTHDIFPRFMVQTCGYGLVAA